MRNQPDPDAVAYGIDIGKKVFHVAAVDKDGAPIQRTKFSRETLLKFFATTPAALIGMEACAGSQWLARKLIELGHDAKIIPARFVKPYVKSNKTDAVEQRRLPKRSRGRQCALCKHEPKNRSTCKLFIAFATA